MDVGSSGLSVGEMSGIATLMVTIVVQSFGFWKYMQAELRKRDEALEAANADRNRRLEALSREANIRHENMRAEFARTDRDLLNLRSEIRERLAAMPNTQQIEQLLDRRFGRLEQKVDGLTHELAARGIRAGGERREHHHREDD